MDHLEPHERSKNMSRIRSGDTKPELVVRKLCWSLGYRYRLHAAHLPGKPDLVFPSLRKVVLVNGCFWHLHRSFRRGNIPKSRRSYWLPKLEGNKRRDALDKRRLTQLGWEYLVVWECQITDVERLETKLQSFLVA